LIEPEMAPFDPQTLKTLYPRTKHEVDRCGDMAIQISTYHEWCIWDPHFGEGKIIGIIDHTNGKSDSGFP